LHPVGNDLRTVL